MTNQIILINTPEEMRKVLRHLNRNLILWNGEKKIPQTTIKQYLFPVYISADEKRWNFQKGANGPIKAISVSEFL